MSSTSSPTTWSDPQYVATVVGVLATGALCFYSGLTQSGPTTEENTFVLLTITLPMTVSYEITRRWA